MGRTVTKEGQDKDKEKRPRFVQGDVVFAKYLSLWSKCIYIQHNVGKGTIRVRIGGNPVDLRAWEVEAIKRDYDD